MDLSESLSALEAQDAFASRHIGPDDSDLADMLKIVGAASIADLAARTVPGAIRVTQAMDLPPPLDEAGLLAELAEIASRNEVRKSLIGCGYHGTHTPPVILRNILENPGWYTAYTPYQSEISQGRLEALLNFQTVIADLTCMPVANASLLDEATAVAEGVAMAHAVSRIKGSAVIAVAADLHPQTRAVLQTRATPLGWTLIDVQPGDTGAILTSRPFAAVLQYPGTTGAIRDLRCEIEAAHEAGALAIVAADLLSLVLLTPPGEMGADVVCGSAQRFGVPMGFGGPHAAFFATRENFRRAMPGRLVGVSQDAAGAPALRLALQTREQHIRREKATSNICTAQVLLAVMAGFYAAWHGPQGLRRIATRINTYARILAATSRFALRHRQFFDTLTLETGEATGRIMEEALAAGFNFRRIDDAVSIALDETVTRAELVQLCAILGGQADRGSAVPLGSTVAPGDLAGNGGAIALGSAPDLGRPVGIGAVAEPVSSIPGKLSRTSSYLQHPVFSAYHAEHAMLRYMKKLENRDIALNRGMIPLGSCTMKLNAAAEMLPITWPGFANIHPFAPVEQTRGYGELVSRLSKWLATATGFAAVSLQPNAGSQGEYAGLLAIRGYHAARGEAHRDICLIPSSAHGTNPASAAMAGLKIVVLACDRAGNIDLDDLRAQAAKHADRLAALMVTYPSTHGVFEIAIRDICSVVHDHGGQVYMDGANMNAQLGLTSPGAIGADVCHLNLHKTFCIPHGGGGPGVGPIGVAAHLAPYLPNHPFRADAGPESGIGPVSAAPFGSASILPISYAYIRMMGAAGLKRATEIAILNANYIAARLRAHYPILYAGAEGFVAHECILDCRGFAAEAGIQVEDIAKRLQDYGFHAPTMSWPVPGTLMVEPTESEPLAELDRFCDAMIAIRAEIAAIAQGSADRTDNALRNAPHTAGELMAEVWRHPYSREHAAYPTPGIADAKYWPPVKRVDNAYGDRNLVCTCAPIASYAVAAE